MGDVRLRGVSVLSIRRLTCGTYINLPILKTLLQVVIDTFVGNGRQQRHIRHADLFLLESFLPVGLRKEVSDA